MNTIITERTPNGDITFDVFSKLIGDRILFIYDYIDDRVATDIVATLLLLDSANSSEKISLYINSDGGDIRSIFMIYDIMNLIKSPIQTICLGSASFASIILLAAGTKGMRYATRSSLICVSQLFAEGIVYADMVNAKIAYEQLKRDNKKFVEALAKLTGKTAARIQKDLHRKVFMSPAQAKKYKLIDHVIEWNK